MANRLAGETSPYLLQHKDNPVDWYPWGEEALARARDEDRPILLSIGYSAATGATSWSASRSRTPDTAALMNERFVCIKLDREERPDLDSIYMEAVQAMTGQGGWPLNVFLTPEQVPFFARHLLPARVAHGHAELALGARRGREAWDERRDEIAARARGCVERLRGGAPAAPSERDLDPGVLDEAVDGAEPPYDRATAASAARRSSRPRRRSSSCSAAARRDDGRTHAARDGVRRHVRPVGGGFARYSVDPYWLVPHFEKMLYDNALLARAYLHGWQVTGEPLFRTVASETLDWALREMRGPEGGFYSALDADSEGEEGRFYVWTVDELRAALEGEPDADEAIAWFGATDRGNFEGRNIPVRGPGEPERRGAWRERLYEARAAAGLARARRQAPHVLERADDRRARGRRRGARARRLPDAARARAEFVLGELRDADGRLLRTWKDGEAKLNAYLEDHAFLLEALLSLYEATFEPRWFAEARALADTMIERFADDDNGGFFETSSDHEQLVARRKDLEDHPIPSGNSSAAYGLLRLAALTGEHEYAARAESVLRLLHELAPSTRRPSGTCSRRSTSGSRR